MVTHEAGCISAKVKRDVSFCGEQKLNLGAGRALIISHKVIMSDAPEFGCPTANNGLHRWTDSSSIVRPQVRHSSHRAPSLCPFTGSCSCMLLK